jgi:hypothetical protein
MPDETVQELCESDGMAYTTDPIQHRCKHCGQMWFPSRSKPPVCKNPPQVDWLTELENEWLGPEAWIFWNRSPRDIENVERLIRKLRAALAELDKLNK